jgi:hypothetical protein
MNELVVAEERIAERRPTYVDVATPELVPLYRMVPIRGPSGEVLESYRGVEREDTGTVVSVVSDRYGLVQHRDIARAVHAVGQALDKPDLQVETLRANPHFKAENIRLYAQGRRMEVKLVIGQKFKLDAQNEFYPAVRVFNSLDGAWAVRAEAFGVRLACTNQLFAGARSFLEFRELHLSSPSDLLGQMEKAIYEALDHFDGALDLYAQAMEQHIPVTEFVPALEGAGLPQRHVKGMAAGLPDHFGSVVWGEISRWDAYQLATSHLTHQVHVNPERERQFERAAARALLLTEGPALEGGDEVPA